MLASIKNLLRNSKGFTLVELNISMVLLGIVGASLMGVMIMYVIATTRTNSQIEMTGNSQNLLRTMVEELRYGAGVRQTNLIPDSNGPAGGWNTGNASFVIITAVPALDISNEYIIDPVTGDPYFNEYVYFRSGTLLYKRTLAHASAIGNRLTTSCPAAAATVSCPADRMLVEDLKTIGFSLYDQNNVTNSNAALARSVLINLTLERNTFGNPLTFDNSVRITLRNSF